MLKNLLTNTISYSLCKTKYTRDGEQLYNWILQYDKEYCK